MREIDLFCGVPGSKPCTPPLNPTLDLGVGRKNMLDQRFMNVTRRSSCDEVGVWGWGAQKAPGIQGLRRKYETSSLRLHRSYCIQCRFRSIITTVVVLIIIDFRRTRDLLSECLIRCGRHFAKCSVNTLRYLQDNHRHATESRSFKLYLWRSPGILT